jgi:hypothetical protein
MTGNHDPLDDAVESALDAEGKGVNTQRMVERVRVAQMVQVASAKRRKQLLFGSLAALAASLLVVFFFIQPAGTKNDRELSAEEVVREAKNLHETTAQDRCYRVESDWDVKPALPRFRFLPIARTGLIWTRGDQFLLQSTVEDQHWAWGQGASGQVWLAPSRKQAIVFAPTELNEPLAHSCELMSLRLVTTLGELLEKFQLSRTDEPGDIVIHGQLKPGQALGLAIRKITLKLDRNTKTVKYAELLRYFNGEPIGRIRFELIETRTQKDGYYDVSSHTDANAVILDGKPLQNPPMQNRTKLRDDLLKRLQDRAK